MICLCDNSNHGTVSKYVYKISQDIAIQSKKLRILRNKKSEFEVVPKNWTVLLGVL